MPYIVKQAIHQHYSTFNIHDSGVTAGTLTDYAAILLRDGNFSKAYELYEETLRRAPHDHRAHWGKLLVQLKVPALNEATIAAIITERYNVADEPTAFFNTLCNPHYKNAVRHATDDAKAVYMACCEMFVTVAGRQRDVHENIKNKRTEIAELHHTISQKRIEQAAIQSKLNSYSGNKWRTFFVVLLIILAVNMGTSAVILLFLAIVGIVTGAVVAAGAMFVFLGFSIVFMIASGIGARKLLKINDSVASTPKEPLEAELQLLADTINDCQRQIHALTDEVALLQQGLRK
jgi:hypothetical protein